jgi:hypothetical protein
MPTRRTRLRCAAILRIRLGCQPTRRSGMAAPYCSCCLTGTTPDTFSLANGQVMADVVVEDGRGVELESALE